MLTVETRVTHDISILSPLIRKEIIQPFRDDGQKHLSVSFCRIFECVPGPLFTPIYDHASPTMTVGRVAMVSDAALAARPHIGAGVTKSAEDARSLAEALEGASRVTEVLVTFDDRRSARNRMAYEWAQSPVEWLMPRCTNEAERVEWANKHNLETIMCDTVVMSFY